MRSRPRRSREAAGTYLDPERTVITVVADRFQVEKDLAPLGQVTVYDSDGERLE